MRNKAILILLVFLALTGLICFFWGNSFITWALENSIQTIIGAKADIEGFRLNPFNLAVKIDGMQITNPADTWKNIIDTKKISFKLAPEPLFEGKTVIDEIVVEDLTFNTPRQTDGKIVKKKESTPGPLGKAQAKLMQNIAQMPILNPATISKNLDVDKITASYEFKTDLSAGRIKAELSAYQNKWDANLNDIQNLKAEFKSLEHKISQIKNLNSKNLLELKKQLDLIKEIQNSAKQIRTKIRTTDDQFKKDNQMLEDAIKGLRQEAEADYQALLALAKVPDIGSINFTEALLGKTMVNTSTTFLKLADDLRKSLPAKMENPPKVKHSRGGQNIIFPGRKTHPRFLIKKVAISGKGTPDSFMDGFYAKGALTGITSEPPIYGLPMTASVLATAPNQASLELNGQINHIAPAFNDQLKVKLKNLPLPQIDLADSDYLPSRIISGKAEIEATMQITPGSMKLKALLTGTNIKSDYSGKSKSDDLISEIVRKTFANLNQIKVNYQVDYIAERLDIKISSNLDRLITDGIKEAVGEKVTGFTRELRAKVDAKLLKEEQVLQQAKQKYQNEIAVRINEVQMELNRKEQELEAKKKELEAKIKQGLMG